MGALKEQIKKKLDKSGGSFAQLKEGLQFGQIRSGKLTKPAPSPWPERRLGKTEEDDALEIEMLSSQLDRAKEQITEGFDIGYYVPLVFVSRKQADEFVAAMGWESYSDETGAFLDGVALAQALEISLTPCTIKFREQQSDTRLIKEVGLIENSLPQKE